MPLEDRIAHMREFDPESALMLERLVQLFCARVEARHPCE
jgi:hypothetical protein